jgi:hypothetical protein
MVSQITEEQPLAKDGGDARQRRIRVRRIRKMTPCSPEPGGGPKIRGTTPCKGAASILEEQPHAKDRGPMARATGWFAETGETSPMQPGTPGLGRIKKSRNNPRTCRLVDSGTLRRVCRTNPRDPDAGFGAGAPSRDTQNGEINPMQSNATVIFRLSPHKAVCGNTRGLLPGGGKRSPPPVDLGRAARLPRPRHVCPAGGLGCTSCCNVYRRFSRSPCGTAAMAPREAAMYIRCGLRTGGLPQSRRVCV